jgi:hypothetical protein
MGAAEDRDRSLRIFDHVDVQAAEDGRTAAVQEAAWP